MNEELQKELLSILREIKTGAPGAWQTLVEQRSAYCWAIAVMCIIISITIVIMSVLARKSALKIESSSDREFAVGLTWALTLAAFIPFLISMPYIAEGIAPLGKVLEILK